MVYYIANTGSAVRIKRYDPNTLEQRVILTPEERLTDQIAASQTGLYVLGTDDTVYRISQQNGVMQAVTKIQDPPISATKLVERYRLFAAYGQLNVYAEVSDSEDQPALMFIEFTTDASAATATTDLLVEEIPVENEERAWKSLQPAVQYAPLAIGSRGDAVKAIQQPLYDHGYYTYYIDGIFGWRTENAVKTLQGDLGRTVTGMADDSLQKLILSGNFPNYDPYSQINYGDRGDRVYAMQLRLRALGYMADTADGIFGRRTQAAVQLFQQENGIAQSANATRDTLVRLFAVDTPQCTSYIPLYLGDSGYRVRELNKRLKELYYLSGSVTDTFTSDTARAIRRFQAQVGLSINGEASVALQQRLFAPGAPECSGYIALYRGDSNGRVA
ncbi:MAG: peptidoglycan-binding protein, partial [Clostridiales bacterium]|nr:peptidoglycan-binding protein [Clostridiales bacterium]